MTNSELIDGKQGMDLLVEVVRILRSEDGCPWDREQTIESLKPYFLEETYELCDAIDSGDPELHKEELGDVLMHILLQAQIRSEFGEFTYKDVADRISKKLIGRHPHVFAGLEVGSTKEVLKNWETLKAEEKKDERESVLDGVPRCLPGLSRSQKIQTRAGRIGFDWDRIEEVIAKVEEELTETKEAIAADDVAGKREEIGDLLFAVVNLARWCDVDAEDAVGGAISKFNRRFREIESGIKAEGRTLKDCTLAELEKYWEETKKHET